MRKVLYTVVTGGYDIPRPVKKTDLETIVLTDDKDLDCPGWEKIVVAPWADSKKLSRYLKIMAHNFIKADVYYYIDANYEVIGDLESIPFIGGYLAFKHQKRKCIYEEARAVIKGGKDSSGIVKKQMLKYSKARIQRNGGLYANGFFIRDRSVDKMCVNWWKEVEEYSYRDQLSLPVVAEGITEMNKIPTGLLILHKHKAYSGGSPDIYYFSPNRGDKKLGEWYNKHCEIVPNDDDWICITDHDVMFLHSYSAKLMEDVIKLHGGSFDLFSCLTNRLGLKYQMPYGMDDGGNVPKQMKIAEYHYKKYYADVESCKKPTAGLLMLFQKKTWKENKFLPGIVGKDGKFIDWQFSNRILKGGGKIGLMKGLYVFHLYRLGKSVRKIDHLR